MDGLKTKQNMFSLPYMNEFVLVCFKIKFLKDWLWRPPVLLVGWYWHCETNFSPTFSKINELLFGAKYLEIKCQIWICMCIVSGGGGPSFFIFEHFSSVHHRLLWWIFARCPRDRMVVGFITTYAISAHHH